MLEFSKHKMIYKMIYFLFIFTNLKIMSSTLHKARILSSETDNTISQSQESNVNIKISKPNNDRSNTIQPVNFTQQTEENIPPSFIPMNQENSQYGSESLRPNGSFQSVPQTSNNFQTRGIADLGNNIEELDKKNKFLEMIIEMYETNPLKINSYVVCESKLLMNMIKLLTDCEKVELVLDDEVGCSGCTGKDKLIYLTKILITKDGKTEDFKISYNHLYCEFMKYGISLKVVV